MAVRTIRLYGDPVLREKAKPITVLTPDIGQLARDMIDTMRKASGLGLAGPQVGVLARLFVLDLSAIDPESILDRTGSFADQPDQQVVLFNPQIIKQEGEQSGDEGCLSFPDLYDKVVRPQIVRVSALDRDGQAVEIEGSGVLARALAHEVDHLDGILFIDRMTAFRLRFIQGRLRKLKKSTEDDLKGI